MQTIHKIMSTLYALFRASQPTPVLLKSQMVKEIDNGEITLIITVGTKREWPFDRN